jgi:hypothetical protein
MVEWLTLFVSATTVAARLARRYLDTVQALQVRWREQLRRADRAPRADAAAWAIIDLLPAHPVLSGPGAVAATGRSKMRVYEAIAQLAAAGVLLPVSSGKRNQLWESAGLIALIERMESGDVAAPAT